jgi:hypothetical protein
MNDLNTLSNVFMDIFNEGPIRFSGLYRMSWTDEIEMTFSYEDEYFKQTYSSLYLQHTKMDEIVERICRIVDTQFRPKKIHVEKFYNKLDDLLKD